MAGEPHLAAETGEDLPDPFDHVGEHARGDDPIISRLAFEMAQATDADDATALRGLAGIADALAENPAEVELLLRSVVRLEPADLSNHVRLIGMLLANGRPHAAEEAFDYAVSLATSEPDRVVVVSDLLAPTVADAVAHGNLPLAIGAAHLAGELEESPRTDQLRRLATGLVEAIEYGEFVTVDRLGTPWWKRPAVLAGLHGGLRRTRWLAARVDTVRSGIAHVHYADVMDGQRRPEDRSWLELPVERLGSLSEDLLPEPLPGAILEIGLYGNEPTQEGDPEQIVVVRVLPNPNPTLPRSALRADRYARAR